jgi:hypothetical protein
MGKLSIRTILISLFGVMALIIAAQGSLALQRMAAINKSAVELGKSWLPSISQIGQLGSAVTRIRIGAARYLMASKPSDVEVIDKGYGELSLHRRDGTQGLSAAHHV